MSYCRSCGAEIDWVRSEKTGNLLPINSEPDPGGNVEIVGEADGTPVVVVHGGARLFGDDGKARYMPHHATCPDARQWSGKTVSL